MSLGLRISFCQVYGGYSPDNIIVFFKGFRLRNAGGRAFPGMIGRGAVWQARAFPRARARLPAYFAVLRASIFLAIFSASITMITITVTDTMTGQSFRLRGASLKIVAS